MSIVRAARQIPVPWILALVVTSWLSPAALAQTNVSGPSVNMAATATDNVGVVGVRFLLDGSQIGAEDTTSPYGITWDSTTVPDGTYTLTAEARDAAGNVGTSAPVTLSVTNSGSGGGDTTAPTVQTTSPANGSVVSAFVNVTASASDDVGVAGVQFLLDGLPLGAEDTAAPYSVSWNTTTSADGTHTLAARARDAAGNQTTSAAISVLVSNSASGDTTAPSVQTTGPANGSTVSGSVAVTASASDNVGVVGVQFLLDGAPLGPEDTVSPYAVNWDTTTAPDGAHILTARARDAAGNQTTSGGISVTVDNSANPGSDPQSSGSGNVDLSIERTTTGFRHIHAESDTGDMLELQIDGQVAASVQSNVLDYDWDVRSLLGQHQIQVFAYTDGNLVASASMTYTIESASVPQLTLEVVEFPIIGATFIQATADVGTPVRLELFVDGELVVEKVGNDIDYAWDPGNTSHQILFVAYDGFGVIGSVSVLYVP